MDKKGPSLQIETSQLEKYPLLQAVIHFLGERQIEAYLVGGAVRDLLLGRARVTDFDFVLPGDGLAIARQVANGIKAAFYPLDPERKTGRVVATTSGLGKIYLDFASYRGESLEADLADRDFTINAIALSLTGSPLLIDPWQGQRDLANTLIRATSEVAFEHDPVRVLRAVRQAIEFGFTIEPETETLIRQAAHRLPAVSSERQRDELLKLLNTPAPGQAVQILRRLEVLSHFLPEVQAMAGVGQSAPHHLDVFDHTALALDIWSHLSRADWTELPEQVRPEVQHYLNEALAGELSRRLAISLALLLHDTGKSLTRTEEKSAKGLRTHFYGHEQESAKITRRVMNRFHFSSQATQFVERVVAHHMRPLLLANETKLSRRAVYRFFRDTAGPTFQAGPAVALHALADRRATYPPGQGQAETKALLQVIHQLLAAYFAEREQVIDPPPLLTGHDLMENLGLAEGSLIGQLLQRLREAQATGQVTSKADALEFIKSNLDFAHQQSEDL
jgi:tRNA nucleotidyltransferase/poly(A) polymerase